MVARPHAPRGMWVALVGAIALGCGSEDKTESPPPPGGLSAEVLARLKALTITDFAKTPPDSTNKWADDPAAAALGKKFFFEKRFSGQLLDDANEGEFAGALGLVGETGKVSCSGCHVPRGSFSDVRTPRRQNSLGAGWTRRRAPSLLDAGQATLLNWDGRRDTAYSQVFTPMEDPLEFNSSRLFVAQQVAHLYKAEYEALFGPLPASLATFAPVAAKDAGCNELPTTDGPHGDCVKPGHDDEGVTRVVVNVGKAVSAYVRKLKCGPTRFDAWMAGDAEALTPDEQAGAALFVGKGACNACHTGPYLTDQRFHNVGLSPRSGLTGVPDNFEDPGASPAVPLLRADPLNSKGAFSDGSDDRQAWLAEDPSMYLGAFKTPTLRCVSRRPSFGHGAQFRAIDDVVQFFVVGGEPSGFLGVSENQPRDVTPAERKQLVAFLRALDGTGPDPDLVTDPVLPVDDTADAGTDGAPANDL
jgi:cytochrome c peroxidase